MAGNIRRSANRAWSAAGLRARVLARGLRLEQLEDRYTPAIDLIGIPTWLSAGPAPAINGGTTGITTPVPNPETGAAQRVIPHPTDPNILFAAGVNGGLWRTTDALDPSPNWVPLTDQLPSLSVGDVDMNPANPNQMVIGVGSFSSLVGTGGDLVGVYYTTNALAPNPQFTVLGGVLANQNIRAVLVRDGYLAAGGDNGFYRSLDNGASFATLSGTGGLPTGKVFAAIADPANPNRVYVGVSSGIFRTDNITAATPSWVNVTPQGWPAAANVDNIKLAIHNSPGNNIIYAGVTNQGVLALIDWSSNQGGAWTAMDRPSTLTAPLPISGASNATPIQITTPSPVQLNTGDQVFIQGVQGNTAANGLWTVTVTSATTFTLNGSAGSGAYTGGGTYSRAFGIHPGAQGMLYFSLAADPTDPNIVYIGGDRQESPFPTSIGARNFTGNLMRGNRSAPVQTPSQPTSPQWVALTDVNGAGTAPHADSRTMAVDAAGNLYEGDDGGVYRRTQPKTTTGHWESANGNLSLGQIVSIKQDTLNHVLFAGMQDADSVEQLDGNGPAGNTTWVARFGGDGYNQGVDDTSTPDTSYRYSMNNSYAYFQRRQYDNTNTLVATTPVMLAAPATPTQRFSGISPVDTAAAGLTTPFAYALNAVDPRLLMLGLFHVYEDADPTGLAGDTIVDVTPSGVTQQTQLTSAIAYGGRRNGTAFPRIAYVGFSTGELFVRGETGGFVQRFLPKTGNIKSIVLDPEDWTTAYILVDNSIYQTTDGGATFTDITGNLVGSGIDANGNVVGGLSTELYTLALWEQTPGTAGGKEILLAGGRGGVFRRVPDLVDPDAAGPWMEYGVGLPNSPAYSLDLRGNRLAVGTQGRGAFVIPDVSPTIDTKAIVTIRGDANGNTLTLAAFGGNPNVVFASDGLGNTLAIDRNVVSQFNIIGSGGPDTIVITAGTTPNSDLSFVAFPVNIDAGGDAGDTLIVRNGGRSSPVTATITADQIGGGAFDNLFTAGPLTRVNYTGFQNGAVILDLGAAAPGGNVVNVESTSARTTQVLGGAGADEVRVNSKASGSNAGSLDAIVGDVVVDGRGGGDTLRVSDQGTLFGNSNVFIGPSAVSGLLGTGSSQNLFYSNVANLVVTGSDSGLAEQYTVDGPSAALTLDTMDGPDTVNLRSNTLAVAINTGAGNDTINVSSDAGAGNVGTLAGLAGPVAIEAGSGDNRLTVSNFGSPVGGSYLVGYNAILGATPGGVINYSATGGRFFSPDGNGVLFVGSNVGNDSITVTSSLAGSQLAVDGAGGDDTISAVADTLNGDVALRGGAGNDTFGLNGGVAGVTADSLRISGGTGTNVANIQGFNATAAADDLVGVVIADPVTGGVNGLGRTFLFDNIATLNYDALGGTNRLNVIDATGGSGNQMLYRPTNSDSGTVTINGGTVGPVINFAHVNGPADSGLVLGGAGGTVTVLGASDAGMGSGLGEVTVPNGADVVTVTGRGVTVRNNSLGLMRPVAFAPGTFTNLVVRTGNEAGQGDKVTVTPSRDLNIYIDAGSPVGHKRGDQLIINGLTADRRITQATDPVTGQLMAKVTIGDSASVAFAHFESDGGLRSLTAIGADAGGGPRVKVLDSLTQQVLFDGFVYDPGFRGGVRVATGDVTGDGIPDVIVAAGTGGGPHIQVLDGLTFQVVASFFAYEPSFTGGVYVAVGDVNGDGVGEIITGPGAGGGPLVKIFDGAGRQLNGFFAFDPNFRGGVRVAAADVSGDGLADIIVGTGVGGGPLVRVFDGATQQVLTEFFAGDPNSRDGVFVTGGDLDGDGLAEVIVGPDGPNASAVTVRTAKDGSLQTISVFDIGQIGAPGSLPAVDTSVLSATGTTQNEAGLRVAVADLDTTGDKKKVLVSRGPGYPSRVKSFRFNPLSEVDNFLAFEEGFTNGVFVG